MIEYICVEGGEIKVKNPPTTALYRATKIFKGHAQV